MSEHAIYVIVNKVNSLIYVGSAVNFRRRWTQHKVDLNSNRHDNSYLQAAWNKYGSDSFELRILEYVIDKLKLIEREQYWIDCSKSYERHIGYNLNRSAINRLGSKWSEEAKKKFSEKTKGRIISIETKAKMSAAQLKRRHIQSEKIKGKKHSEEAKDKIREQSRNVLKWPHGYNCRCDDCRQLRNKFQRDYRNRQIRNNSKVARIVVDSLVKV